MSEYVCPWNYQGQSFKSEDIGDWFGFVYAIVNTLNNKTYIGKKLFYHSLSRKPLKGHTRRRRYRKESDWKRYWGSNKQLIADFKKHGPEQFERTILKLCLSKGEATYWEAWHQLTMDVLRRPDDFYNEWVICKVHRAHLKS